MGLQLLTLYILLVFIIIKGPRLVAEVGIPLLQYNQEITKIRFDVEVRIILIMTIIILFLLLFITNSYINFADH